MELKDLAILMVLALIGLGVGFAFVEFVVSGTSKDIWLYEELKSMPMLTEEQRQKTIEIAIQNETVKQYLEQGYEIDSAFFFSTSKGARIESVYITLRKGEDWVFANVDLSEEKVTGILKSRGEIAGLEMREDGEIKAVNETELRIAIGGREGKLIKAPEVRELTKEEREKARKIALSDPEVQNIINGKSYEMKIRPAGVIITTEAGEVETKFNGASIMFELEDGTVYFVHVDLEKGKVIRISPPLYRHR